MTFKEREEIFAKEVLTNEDLAKLYDIDITTACLLSKRIRLLTGDRLGIKGKLHIEDYLKWLKKSGDIHTERYAQPETENAKPLFDEYEAIFSNPQREVKIYGTQF